MLRGWSLRAGGEQTAGFDQLRNDKSWNSKAKFAKTRDQRQSECALTRYPEKTSNKNVTALLDTKSGGHGEGSGADCECRGLKDKRVEKRSGQIHRIKRNPDLTGCEA